jgi:hypothetical protein
MASRQSIHLSASSFRLRAREAGPTAQERPNREKSEPRRLPVIWFSRRAAEKLRESRFAKAQASVIRDTVRLGNPCGHPQTWGIRQMVTGGEPFVR